MPTARAAVTVVPQIVAYIRLGVPSRILPSWIHFGGAQDGITYGLAEIGRDALKVGLHVTKGPGADPDSLSAPSSGELEALRAKLDRILTVPVRELLGGERCLYTMTAMEDFLIDTWPGDPRVAFASACSGHGFKFAPLTGRILAELIVNGQAHLPDGLDVAALFALRRPPAPAPAVSSQGLPGPTLASSPSA
jgi:sarcosine oxidase